MKTIGFVVTNYNNSKYTADLIESLKKQIGDFEIVPVVVDNASCADELNKLAVVEERYSDVKIIRNSDNLGYFNGLNVGLKYLLSTHQDVYCVVVGNNDLIFNSDFCAKLIEMEQVFSDKPVVAPDIITLDGIHQNPHVVSNISRLREIVWDLYYSNYYLAMLISKVAQLTSSVTQRKDFCMHEKSRYIYQGYGACYVLTRSFIENFCQLFAPTFLMGEEFFLAYQLGSKGYLTYYCADIQVLHHDHASVGTLPRRQFWEIARTAHKVYRRYVNPYSFKFSGG